VVVEGAWFGLLRILLDVNESVPSRVPGKGGEEWKEGE
jgi:hypothetical protein